MTSNGHSKDNCQNGGAVDEPDLIMMTPLKKELDHTVLRVERVSKCDVDNESASRHVAGGQHQGIIINKQIQNTDDQSLDGTQQSSRGVFHLRLSFKVFLVNSVTQTHQQECRELRFWFAKQDQDSAQPSTAQPLPDHRLQCAQAFFRALVNPTDFPQSYVGFIMKLMKTMQQVQYRPLVQIELVVRSIDEPFERPPSSSFRPSKHPTVTLTVKPSVQSELRSDNGMAAIDQCTLLPDLIPGDGQVAKHSQVDCRESSSDRIGNSRDKCKPRPVNKRGPPPPVPPKPSRLRSLAPSPPKPAEALGKQPEQCQQITMVSTDANTLGQLIELTEEKVLEMIESAYPNPLSLPDIAASTCSKEEEVHHLVMELVSKGVARITDLGQVVRVTSDETQVKRVRQMPEVVRSQQPTIAIITAHFAEKVAVDAMIENKDTYVRYKGEGESNLYTLGNIGVHRVVATKLPAVGNSRSAMIAAGNTTTRLLGTFQHVEYVFLVGIGGGVPHYTDPKQHVRLGDVVVSSSPFRVQADSTNQPQPSKPTRSDYVYVHCEKLRSSPDEPLNASNSTWKELKTVDSFNYRFWCPHSLELQDLAKKLYQNGMESGNRPWEQHFQQAKDRLCESEDLDFVRPDQSTDKLYMSIGSNDVIEMAHPEMNDNSTEYDPRQHQMPVIHFGAIGSGRMAIGNEQLRQDIALKYGIKAFDIEFDTVIESIFGNRKDRYIVIRGVADYKDGSRKKEWQPYAALAAASFMKAILCELGSLPNDD